MHPSSWIRLLRRLPPELIDNLALVTTNGTELSLQSLVRLDEEFLVVRARVAGSSDAGRAFFIPYDQINFVGYQKPVKEEDLRALFDGPEPMPLEHPRPSYTAPPLALPVHSEPAVHSPTPDPTRDAGVPSLAPVAGSPPVKASGSNSGQGARALPTKSKVLANLRARLKTGDGSSSK